MKNGAVRWGRGREHISVENWETKIEICKCTILVFILSLDPELKGKHMTLASNLRVIRILRAFPASKLYEILRNIYSISK